MGKPQSTAMAGEKHSALIN